jgi:hypothetical protein
MEHSKYCNVGPKAEHTHGCISVIAGMAHVCGKRPSVGPISVYWVNGLIKYRLHPVNRGTLLVAQLVEALRYKPKGRGFYS